MLSLLSLILTTGSIGSIWFKLFTTAQRLTGRCAQLALGHSDPDEVPEVFRVFCRGFRGAWRLERQCQRLGCAV